MKNSIAFLALFFLVALLASAARSEMSLFSNQAGSKVIPEAAPKNLYIRLNLGYGGNSYSYDVSRTFTEYWETGSLAENYSIENKGLVFEVGLGFFFIKYLGMEVSFAPGLGGKSSGDFYLSFPHPLYFDLFREANETQDNLKYGVSELNLNLVFRYPAMDKLHIYASVGGTYFLGVKAESLETFTASETSYPYTSINVDFETKEYSASNFGFNVGGGIDFYVTNFMAINLNVRYSMGSVTMKLEEVGLAEEAEFELKPGSFRALLGIKIGLL